MCDNVLKEDLENGITIPEAGENPWFSMLRSYAAIGIMAQGKREGDILADNGEMWCGVCGERRRKYIDLENGNHKTPLLVSCKCRCDREREAETQAEVEKQNLRAFISDLYNNSMIDGRLRDCTFERFSVNESNEKIKKICFRYASSFDEMEKKNQGILMYGSPGTGKTFAAACIANYLISRGVYVIMTSFVKVLSMLDTDHESEDWLLDKLSKARLLIIDDLGAERSTEYALEKVYNIIDTRYREGKPMILTTNLTSKELSDTSDMRYYRIYDRVWEVCFPMKFQGNSWRMQEAGERYKEMERFLTDG